MIPPRLTPLLLAFTLLVPVGSLPADSGDAVPISAAEVSSRWHGRLDKHHFIARVRLDMRLAGLVETRELTVFRDDDGEQAERVMIRFEAPADLRRVAVLYLEHDDRPNDYFLYQPATRRVRRLPSSIADDDVYGIDLEFLGFGVAQSEPTRIDSVRAARIDGRPVYRLEESALELNTRFTRRITWIDVENFIPLRTEHYLAERLALVAESRGIRLVQGIPTPGQMHFQKPIENREVMLHIDSVDYQRELPEEAFSVLNLTKGLLAR